MEPEACSRIINESHLKSHQAGSGLHKDIDPDAIVLGVGRDVNGSSVFGGGRDGVPPKPTDWSSDLRTRGLGAGYAKNSCKVPYSPRLIEGAESIIILQYYLKQQIEIFRPAALRRLLQVYRTGILEPNSTALGACPTSPLQLAYQAKLTTGSWPGPRRWVSAKFTNMSVRRT